MLNYLLRGLREVEDVIIIPKIIGFLNLIGLVLLLATNAFLSVCCLIMTAFLNTFFEDDLSQYSIAGMIRALITFISIFGYLEFPLLPALVTVPIALLMLVLMILYYYLVSYTSYNNYVPRNLFLRRLLNPSKKSS